MIKRLHLAAILGISLSLSSCSKENDIEEAVKANLNDPESAQFGKITIAETSEGKKACATVNSKNQFGGYVGDRQFVLNFDKLGQEWRVIEEFSGDHGSCSFFIRTTGYRIDKDSGETSMTIEGKDGTATMRSGADVPVSLPAGFSLYPGSKVVTNTVVNQPDGQGTMVMFETDAAADKVIAHFREQAKAAGFDIQLEMNTNGTQMIGGESKDGSTLSVTASPGGESGTTGQLIIGSNKGG
jgi:hypothetical protein